MEDTSSQIQNKLEIDTSYIPRIIKPRKRRKKEKILKNNSTTAAADKYISDTFTFSFKNELVSSQDSGVVGSNSSGSMRTKENEFYFLNNNANDSQKLSIISLSEQIFLTQLNSSITSCSCHLCKPNQKIWSFSSQQKTLKDFDFEILCAENKMIKNNFGAIGSNREIN